MARFVTIGYGDAEGYERTDQQLLDAAHADDARQRKAGVVMGVAGVPVQVRNPSGAGVERSEGPYGRAPLPLAGFSIIEADSLDEAVEIAGRAPCAIAEGVVEVWPLLDTPG
ncbi:MAG TPA: YciI family protein [Marmoricola sp.]|jgi:hypothetical protein|nr:YciI family protein [Marmoricola sp.]